MRQLQNRVDYFHLVELMYAYNLLLGRAELSEDFILTLRAISPPEDFEKILYYQSDVSNWFPIVLCREFEHV